MISVAIFGMTTSDISKLLLLYVISRAVRRVKFETILKYHEWYLCQITRTNPRGGGTLGISGWGCAAGTLEPLTYTRASSAEFCYPILE